MLAGRQHFGSIAQKEAKAAWRDGATGATPRELTDAPQPCALKMLMLAEENLNF